MILDSYFIYNSPINRLIGKIKSFRSDRSGGTLVNIGGKALDFDTGAAPLSEGQIVTYTEHDGEAQPGAADVRPQE